MNTVFVAIDGDNVGAKVGQSVLHDDPSALAEISQKLSAGLEAIKQWTEANQGSVISLGGDEGVLVFENVENEDSFLDEIENLRQAYLQATGATITAGAGFSLSEAGKALLAGKLSGKDMVVPYGEEIEDILHDAHQHVLEGESTEEEQKLDDHYISHIDDSDFEDEDLDGQETDENSDGQYLIHSDDDQEMAEDDQQEPTDLDQGDFDYNPDDYKFDSDELPEEEMQSQSHEDHGSEDQTSEGMDGGAEEMADGSPDMEEEPDEFSSSTEDMQGRVDDVMESPDMQGEFDENHEQEEDPIEIPENENMESADEMQSEELPMQSDEDSEQDPSVEMDAFNQMLSESGQNVGKMKQQVAASLSAFKEQKDQLVAIQDQMPELYEATLGMLQTMLDLSKALFGGGEEENSEQSQEEMSPDIADGVPDEYMEQETSPKF